MNRLILLGSPGTKRADYLKKGAAAAGAEIEILDWKEFPGNLLEYYQSRERAFLKIDPPRWDSCCLKELKGLVGEYEENLQRLARLGKGGRVCFFNDPNSIRALLDKKGCKRRLMEANIPVTEQLEFLEQEADRKADRREYPLFERLLGVMTGRRVFQVFLKPNYGSGAAGVMALRYEPVRGEAVLYTCAALDPVTGRLVNTKELRRFTDRQQVFSMAERLLEMDCIVERWYAKAEYKGYSYDLRAVVQDGELDFVLARLSKGPVTNLQLNNHPLRARKLELSRQVWDEIQEICRQAAGCYPGLRSVGIDILLEKRSLRPRIIEMNGQGDLIYQDIYGENRIYRRQGQIMKEWLQQEDQKASKAAGT